MAINITNANRWEDHVVIEDGVNMAIVNAGYDGDNEHFVQTPVRWRKAIMEFAAPKETDGDIFSKSFAAGDYRGMVVQRNLEFTSLCPHHLFPYMGTAAVGYIPGESIVGISKLARCVEWATHRIITQEESTALIVGAIVANLEPLGAIAVLRGVHTCMGCRGIRRPTAETITSEVRGVFLDVPAARAEFMGLLG